MLFLLVLLRTIYIHRITKDKILKMHHCPKNKLEKSPTGRYLLCKAKEPNNILIMNLMLSGDGPVNLCFKGYYIGI